MENEKIIDGNKIIAEFMGWKYCKKDLIWTSKIDGKGITVSTLSGWVRGDQEYKKGVPLVVVKENKKQIDYLIRLHYHKSWDWLMPVVEKIEEIGYSVEIFKSASHNEPDKILHRCVIEKMTNWNDLLHEDNAGKQYVKNENKILSVWIACVNFIKWYNKAQLS